MRFAAFMCALAAAGCQAPYSTATCRAPSTAAQSFRVTQLALPASYDQFGAPLDCPQSMKCGARNSFGNLMMLLSDADPQQQIDDSIQSGSLSIAIDLVSSDGAGGDGAAGARFANGSFCGSLAAGNFLSAPVLAGDPEVELDLTLAFLGSTPIPIHLAGAQLSFDRSIGGMLAGAIRQRDLTAHYLPALASAMTAFAVSTPGSPAAQSLVQTYDNGGQDDRGFPCSDGNECASGVCADELEAGYSICTPPAVACPTTRSCDGQPPGAPACRNLAGDGPRAGLCADACDGIIDACELARSYPPEIFRPDVSLFDASGRWAPDDTREPDALSFGIGFAARPE